MTKIQEIRGRRLNVMNHIKLLEARYSPSKRAEVVKHLKARLAKIKEEEKVFKSCSDQTKNLS